MNQQTIASGVNKLLSFSSVGNVIIVTTVTVGISLGEMSPDCILYEHSDSKASFNERAASRWTKEENRNEKQMK